MSEISLNVAPAPELLIPAAGPGNALDRARPAADVAGATNPFAALLSGVLGGTQPPAFTATTAPEPAPAEAATLADGTAPDATLLSVPGFAAPLPAASDALPGSSGNPLPATGNSLPPAPAPVVGNAAVPPGTKPNTAADPAPEPPPLPADAGRARPSLADLALSRPLEAAPAAVAPGADEGARTAAAATLAGRAVPAASTKLADDASAQSAYLSRFLDQAPGASAAAYGTGAIDGTLAGADLALRLRGAELSRIPGLPAGTDFLAAPTGAALPGPLAAFAAGSESGGGSALASTPATSGLATMDGGSAALLNRLGSTTLPALQPLGDAGSFAGGLADRLLTVGGPGTHTARLKLHPENLGELDVEITMDDGTAQVWFGTSTSQARDAIEGSLPRLRELFADQGIDLTRTQIDASGSQAGSSGFGQERRMASGAEAWNAAPAWEPGRGPGTAEAAGRAPTPASTRLLDVWA